MSYVVFQWLHFITQFLSDFAGVTMPETVMDAITAALPRLDEDRLMALVERLLLIVGIEEVKDLYVKEADIQDILTPLHCRKLIEAFQRRGLSNFVKNNNPNQLHISMHVVIVMTSA